MLYFSFVCLLFIYYETSLSNLDTLAIPVFIGSKYCIMVATSCPFTLIPIEHVTCIVVKVCSEMCIRISIRIIRH